MLIVVSGKVCGSSMTFLFALLLLFFFYYRFTLIDTAIHTYMVRENGFMTLRAK
jgi:hypothetical protein